MSLAAGTRLGPYEVLSPIGKGGMGEVYRARDTTLDRDVAIKVLPEAFASDVERLARFEREAKLLASLNHPNIASIYDLEESDGVKALILELVEGPTLAERIAEGPIPVDEAIAIANQIAEALEAGHEAGVIHRDLKPANIKLREDGTVKVLDYGLAKAFERGTPAGADSELSQSPTLTRQGTQLGVILGTAAYMSPEQAKGKRVDKRTDIWAFGAVVYEMLTAKRAFVGEDVSETLAAVLRAAPELGALPSETPESVRRVLQLCLTKAPKERARDIGDVRLALKGAFGTTVAPDRSVVSAGWGRSFAVALVFSLMTGVAVWKNTRPVETPRTVTRFSIPSPRRDLQFPIRRIVALAPDGSRFVYSGNDQLLLRAMDRTEVTPVPGSEGGGQSPFFSPDGLWIGFYANGQLMKVAARGGAPVRLWSTEFEDPPYGLRWGADDTILFGQRGSGIMQVSADGGAPEVLIPLEDGEIGDGPQFLPGEKSVLFTLGAAAKWDDAKIVVQSLETGVRKVLIEGGRDARYLRSGHLAYVRNGALLAVAFDVANLEVTSGSITLAEGVMTATRFSAAAHFSVSDTGTLVYVARDLVTRATRTLVWVDRDGREAEVPAEPRAYRSVRISPEGGRIAASVMDQENDIWIWDFGRETLTQLTFAPSMDTNPVWSPDGTRVAFTSHRDGPLNVYWKPADGMGAVERLVEGRNMQFPTTFTRDGRQLLFLENDFAGGELRALPLDDAEPLLKTGFKASHAELSPNGRWLAYRSPVSGELYVRPFPHLEDGQWSISRGGGHYPLWSPDGRELFYMAPDATLMAVAVETEPGFAAGKPRALLSGYYKPIRGGRSYDISPDGKRFLMVKEASSEGPTELVVVLNWVEELKRLVPTDH